jgi:hypothetical protein
MSIAVWDWLVCLRSGYLLATPDHCLMSALCSGMGVYLEKKVDARQGALPLDAILWAGAYYNIGLILRLR